ncbi:MAG: hypothetical protein ACE5KO_06210 [Candidatus Bathyarchaeia archaeon]
MPSQFSPGSSEVKFRQIFAWEKPGGYQVFPGEKHGKIDRFRLLTASQRSKLAKRRSSPSFSTGKWRLTRLHHVYRKGADTSPPYAVELKIVEKRVDTNDGTSGSTVPQNYFLIGETMDGARKYRKKVSQSFYDTHDIGSLFKIAIRKGAVVQTKRPKFAMSNDATSSLALQVLPGLL